VEILGHKDAKMIKKPHLIIVIARGEAVRNFIYSDFLEILSLKAKITLLTNIDHPDSAALAKPFINSVIPLQSYKENKWVVLFREIVHTAHYRMIWTEAAKYYWGRHNERVRGKFIEILRLKVWRIFSYAFSNPFMIRIGTMIDRFLSIRLRPTKNFDDIYNKLKPDMVFNCSHIHGVSADLPMRVANHFKIQTGVFLFSWDNLFSRGRIFPNYNKYFVWTSDIRKHLLDLYKSDIKPYQVSVTGTPQFDFHFDSKYFWSKSKLYQFIGLNINRPYILYTTGMSSDFPYEHKILEKIIDFIKKLKSPNKPQLIIRTYVKGTSKEMIGLSQKYQKDNDIFFPSINWDSHFTLPLKIDLYIYSNLLRHCLFGINTASTVSIELMFFQKSVINIGFEPPGIKLDSWNRFSRHINYEHYQPVVESRGVFVAKSMVELINLMKKLLDGSNDRRKYQKKFIVEMFGKKFENKSSKIIAEKILNLL